MNDASGVGCIESIRNLNPEIQHVLRIEMFASNNLLQRLADQVLHSNIGSTLVLPEIEHYADVWMVESGCGPRLSVESLQCQRILGKILGQKLQCHTTAEVQVFRLVHHAHSAAADLSQNAVMGDGLPVQLGRGSHGRKC